MSPSDLAVLGLAAWRLSSLLTQEEGPWDILERMRVKLGMRYDEYSVPYGTNVVTDAMTCVWCFSMWVGFVLTVAYKISPRMTRWFCMPFALSAAAILVNENVGKKEV